MAGRPKKAVSAGAENAPAVKEAKEIKEEKVTPEVEVPEVPVDNTPETPETPVEEAVIETKEEVVIVKDGSTEKEEIKITETKTPKKPKACGDCGFVFGTPTCNSCIVKKRMK